MKLAQTLIKAGPEHRKFLRQIFVSVDITAPLYWWKEFDTYKIGYLSRKRHIYVAAGDLYAVVQTTYIRRHGRLICRLTTMRYILAIVRMRYDINPFAPAGHLALFDITRL